MNKMTPEELEKFIHQQLRGLPARRAPDSLESRVRSAIEQRAAIPWYHQSWSYWPAAIRALFLASATLVTSGVIAAFYLMTRGVDANALVAGAGSRLAIFTQIYRVGEWIVDFASRTVGGIPSLWLYGGLATLAALYAVFFSLSAAAYRALYRRN
jgi:hypothetical protein